MPARSRRSTPTRPMSTAGTPTGTATAGTPKRSSCSAAHRDTGFAAAAIAAADDGGKRQSTARSSIRVTSRSRRAGREPLGRDDTALVSADRRGALPRPQRRDAAARLSSAPTSSRGNRLSAQLSAAAAALWANRPQRALWTSSSGSILPTDLGWSTDTTHFAYWSGPSPRRCIILGRYRDELAAAESHAAPARRSPASGCAVRALAALARPTAALAAPRQRARAPGRDRERPRTRAVYQWPPAVHRNAALGGQLDRARAGLPRRHRRCAAGGDARRCVVPESSARRSARPSRNVWSPAWSLEMLGAYAEAVAASPGSWSSEDSTNVDFRGELAALAAETRRLRARRLARPLARRATGVARRLDRQPLPRPRRGAPRPGLMSRWPACARPSTRGRGRCGSTSIPALRHCAAVRTSSN